MSTRPDRRPGRGTTALITVVLAAVTAATAASCGSDPGPSRASVPAGFRHACGHSGARVTVTKLPVTVRHRACDLTGVMITVPGRGGMVVPGSSGGVGNSAGLTLTVDNGSLDVTLTATGQPGNA